MTEETSFIWNPILRQYQVNAPHRMNRREGSTLCAFCDDVTEGRVGPGEQVWLHRNKFPPLKLPVGEANVVIYNRDHHRSFTQLNVKEVNVIADTQS
jgi:UDPglucose--hexose-1-phosphate uridylyltransferase